MTRSMATGACCFALLVFLGFPAGAAGNEEKSGVKDAQCGLATPGCVAELVKVCQATAQPRPEPIDPAVWRYLTALGALGLILWAIKGLAVAWLDSKKKRADSKIEELYRRLGNVEHALEDTNARLSRSTIE